MKIKSNKKSTPAKVVARKAVKAAAAKDAAKDAKAAKAKDVTFTFHAEKGKAVFVAGEFNQWNPTAKKMAFKKGLYTATVKLAAGTYQYKFVIDGAWCIDPENVNSVPNDQGTFNSLITVK